MTFVFPFVVGPFGYETCAYNKYVTNLLKEGTEKRILLKCYPTKEGLARAMEEVFPVGTSKEKIDSFMASQQDREPYITGFGDSGAYTYGYKSAPLFYLVNLIPLPQYNYRSVFMIIYDKQDALKIFISDQKQWYPNHVDYDRVRGEIASMQRKLDLGDLSKEQERELVSLLKEKRKMLDEVNNFVFLSLEKQGNKL